jgi:hypothetical protein
VRPELRLVSWGVALVAAAAGVLLAFVGLNDVTFAVALILVGPLVYVAALEREDGWRRAGHARRIVVVLVALLAVGSFEVIVGVDWYRQPVGGMWVSSWLLLLLVVSATLGWLINWLRTQRRGR